MVLWCSQDLICAYGISVDCFFALHAAFKGVIVSCFSNFVSSFIYWIIDFSTPNWLKQINQMWTRRTHWFFLWNYSNISKWYIIQSRLASLWLGQNVVCKTSTYVIELIYSFFIFKRLWWFKTKCTTTFTKMLT